MLIYVNQFELDGDTSNEEAFRLISKWLSKTMKEKVTIKFLKSGKEKTYTNGAKIRTYVANDLEPYMFSILFKHPDKIVRGRQWITEIGIKSKGNKTIISILLETDDISSRVKELPKTTKPHIVALIHNSSLLAQDTIGLKVKTIFNDRDELRALDYEVNRSERDFPLVLICTDTSGKFLLDSSKLQEQLIGLAQVIQLNNVNSWTLEKTIGKENCVWDGAIRIIYPKKFRRTKLFRSMDLEKIANDSDNIYHELLSFITHTNNGFNKKKHFSPTDIIAKRSRDKVILLKEKLSKSTDFEELAQQAFDELDKQESILSQQKEEAKKRLDELEYDKLELQEEIEHLEKELNKSKYSKQHLPIKGEHNGLTLFTYGNEIDLYPSEIKELIIKIVKTFLKNTDMQKNDRAYKILDDFLDNNVSDNQAEKKLNEIKKLFKSYNGVTSKLENDLCRLGLEIDQSGEHNAIRFINDKRFTATFAKTPSDKRAANNIVKHIKKALFY